jgi:hypothetical protein
MFRFRFTMVLKRNVLKDRKICGANRFNLIGWLLKKEIKVKNVVEPQFFLCIFYYNKS